MPGVWSVVPEPSYAQDWAIQPRSLRQWAVLGDTNLANMHLKGRRVLKDYGEADRWFRKAADQVYVWYELAARQGDEKATKDRDSLAGEMTLEQIDEAEELVRE